MKPVDRILGTTETKTCAVCGEEFKGIGHNPYPLRKEGRACDNCNYNKVLVARANLYKSKKK